MKKVKDISAPPKGGRWKFVNFEDSFELEHRHYDQLKANVKKFRLLNNYPIGGNFEYDFEQNVCANAHESACEDFEPPTMAKRIKTFAQALVAFTRSGFPLRTAEQVDEVMTICRSCEYYNSDSGTMGVSCRACGCSRVKLWMATEHCVKGKW